MLIKNNYALRSKIIIYLITMLYTVEFQGKNMFSAFYYGFIFYRIIDKQFVRKININSHTFIHMQSL